jgi:predicted nucleotide-binding protein
MKVIHMARRTTPPLKPERPFHTVEQKRQDIERLSRRINELEAFDPQSVTKRFSDPKVTEVETIIDQTLAAVFGHGTVDYERYSSAAQLDHGPVVMNMTPEWIGARGGGESHHGETIEARRYITEGKEQALSLLRQAVRGLEEEIELAEPVSQPSPEGEARSNASRKVFVVHGHDHGAKDAMARFLEKIELQAIILHEQPDQGFTIIEKFETYAKQVAFAVVLLTPDDLGGAASVPVQAARARQNVIFELGYFVGKLGRGRACLLRKGDVEIPSDLYGVIYTDMDTAEGWKLKLVKELKAAGLQFDANKVWE